MYCTESMCERHIKMFDVKDLIAYMLHSLISMCACVCVYDNRCHCAFTSVTVKYAEDVLGFNCHSVMLAFLNWFDSTSAVKSSSLGILYDILIQTFCFNEYVWQSRSSHLFTMVHFFPFKTKCFTNKCTKWIVFLQRLGTAGLRQFFKMHCSKCQCKR